MLLAGTERKDEVPSASIARILMIAGAVIFEANVKTGVLVVATPAAKLVAATLVLVSEPPAVLLASDSVTSLAKFGEVLTLPS